MSENPQDTLFEDLNNASYSHADMERAYSDGMEDLADKVTTLIRDSDFEITLDEIVEFLEAEVGFRPMSASAHDLLEAEAA